MKGFLYIFSRRLLLACEKIYAEPHAHYSASVLIAPDVPLQVITPFETHRSHALIIAPGTHHELKSEGATTVLQLARDLDTFGLLSESFNKDGVMEPDPACLKKLMPVIRTLHESLQSCETAYKSFSQIVETLTGSGQELPEMDLRIAKCLDRIHRHMPENLTAKELADSVALSQDRFLHLFKDIMGLPLRRYMLWTKLDLAAHYLKNGGSLTDAAHEAGFSDSAHLSRTCREMFGIAPSVVFGRSSGLKIQFCETMQA